MFGLVSIRPTSLSPCFAMSALQRVQVDVALARPTGTSTTFKPAMLVVAGLVPCAESGTRITSRCVSPRSYRYLRMISTPVSSPCAPAAGCSVTAAKPAISASISCSSCISAIAPCTLSLGPAAGAGRRSPAMRAAYLVHLRVVLHRARAERVEAGVDRVVQLGQPGVVAHQVDLGHLGQRQVVRAAPPAAAAPRARRRRAGGRPCGPPGRSRKSAARPSRHLLDIVARQLESCPSRSSASGDAMSASASASASISARLFISVTQTSMWSFSSG